MKPLLFAAILVVSIKALALEVEPFDSAEITEAQFVQYHTSVAAELASTRREYASHDLEVYSDEASRASLAFTLPGHPAHPAWVTRYVAVDDGGIYMNVVGYYAGDEAEFVKLYDQYKEMAEDTTNKFRQ